MEKMRKIIATIIAILLAIIMIASLFLPFFY